MINDQLRYPKCVVFGIGNESRGDDAAGPILIERFKLKLEEIDLKDSFTFISDFQLQIEHSLDLAHQDIALFIDAGVPPAVLDNEPFSLTRIIPTNIRTGLSHALSPQELMGIAKDFFVKNESDTKTPVALIKSSKLPEAYLLCIRGYEFELGSPLSSECKKNIDRSFEALVLWLKNMLTAEPGDLHCTR